MNAEGMARAVIAALSMVRVCNILGYTGPYYENSKFSMQVCNNRHCHTRHFMAPLAGLEMVGRDDNWFHVSSSHLQNECP